MSNMQDRLKDHEGFVLKIKDTLVEDIDFTVMRGVMDIAFLRGCGLEREEVDECTMSLPYCQGPGYLLMFKHAWECDPEWSEEDEEFFSGWWVEFGYSDSFTSIISSPVFVGKNGDVYIAEQ